MDCGPPITDMVTLPAVLSSRVQVDCFPGSKLKHAAEIINCVAVPNTQVTCVILSFGLNNRSSPPNYSHPKAEVMLRRARANFPQASIFVPLRNPRHEKGQHCP